MHAGSVPRDGQKVALGLPRSVIMFCVLMHLGLVVREAERVRRQISLLDGWSHRGDEWLVHVGVALPSVSRLEGECE